MEMYFLKSAACLAILMLFYKLLLEKENMHVFKRFYLLGAVLISFVIPSITFTQYVEIPVVPYTTLFEVEGSTGGEATGMFGSLWAWAIWTLYGLGVLFFGIKFCRNLRDIFQKIKRNPQIKAGTTTNVLLKEEVAPHTFWNYIFFNRVKYQERRIPAEVFEHEQAHAIQKHSLDILLMELLQVIFWFHPLLYPVKRAIKLNHEFLADRAVIKKGVRTSTYQETLLAFSSGAQESSLINSINYSSIKKRFTVMKTHTSKTAILIRSLLLVPLLALLVYSCANEELEQPVDQKVPEIHSGKATPEMVSEYTKLARQYNQEAITEEVVQEEGFQRMMYIFGAMTEAQRRSAEALPPPPPPAMSKEQLPPTPPPPSPENAIEYWDAEGAAFYYEGKKITAQEALQLVKTNPALNARLNDANGQKKVEFYL